VASMDGQAQDYVSYLLRLWRVSGGAQSFDPGEAVWRASLEHPLTGERVGFASLDDLVAYLRQATDVEPGPQAGNG
jgi:hypothetical protein